MKTAYVGETIPISFTLSSSETGSVTDPTRIEMRVAPLDGDDESTVTYSDLQGLDHEVQHPVTTTGDHIIVVEVEDSLGRITIGVERLRVLPV